MVPRICHFVLITFLQFYVAFRPQFIDGSYGLPKLSMLANYIRKINDISGFVPLPIIVKKYIYLISTSDLIICLEVSVTPCNLCFKYFITDFNNFSHFYFILFSISKLKE